MFGGWDGTEVVATVYEYDPTQDQWLKRTPMPTPRSHSGAVLAGERIYVLGGKNGDTIFPLNETYRPDRDDGQQNPWSQATAMPEGRYGMGVTRDGRYHPYRWGSRNW